MEQENAQLNHCGGGRHQHVFYCHHLLSACELERARGIWVRIDNNRRARVFSAVQF
jgi:hypothetical protein